MRMGNSWVMRPHPAFPKRPSAAATEVPFLFDLVTRNPGAV